MPRVKPIMSLAGLATNNSRRMASTIGKHVLTPTRKLPASILVIDLEATCWEGNPPQGEQREIIEIGWAVLSLHNRSIANSGSILVRPVKSTLSSFCTSLTTLTQSQVDLEGVTYAEACRILVDQVDSKALPWASYGAWDLRMMKEQCGSFGVGYPFNDDHTNVKSEFQKILGLKRSVGMAGALKQLGRKLEGTHHRGVDDARNIAFILADIWNPKK